MKWRILIWTAVLVALAAAVWLVVEIATSGLDKASAWSGVIVGFCELAALVVGVVALACERRESSRVGPAASEPTAPPPAEKTPAAGSTKYDVDVRGAQGVQIGDGNTQKNKFH